MSRAPYCWAGDELRLANELLCTVNIIHIYWHLFATCKYLLKNITYLRFGCIFLTHIISNFNHLAVLLVCFYIVSLNWQFVCEIFSFLHLAAFVNHFQFVSDKYSYILIVIFMCVDLFVGIETKTNHLYLYQRLEVLNSFFKAI